MQLIDQYLRPRYQPEILIPTDPAWLAVLDETYGFTSPDVS
jgi:hypothetical protein